MSNFNAENTRFNDTTRSTGTSFFMDQPVLSNISIDLLQGNQFNGNPPLLKIKEAIIDRSSFDSSNIPYLRANLLCSIFSKELIENVMEKAEQKNKQVLLSGFFSSSDKNYRMITALRDRFKDDPVGFIGRLESTCDNVFPRCFGYEEGDIIFGADLAVHLCGDRRDMSAVSGVVSGGVEGT